MSLASSKTKASLPMIVDIAIDKNGKELYQVHESKKSVRKEMPLSAHFKSSSDLSFDPSTPSLGMLESLLSALNDVYTSNRGYSNTDDSPNERSLKRKDSTDSLGSEGSREENLWSKDVQNAFEEALAIVPKNGLNKIKLGGKARGRNELISDFIFAKTGKLRSRKQVSSHIQVIKNTTKNRRLIALISDGPQFDLEEDAEESNKHFEEIFSKINLNKSLGVSSFDVSKITSSGSSKRHSSVPLHSDSKRRKQSLDELFSQPPHVCIKNFSMTIVNDFLDGNVITLSSQESGLPKLLSVRENAAISGRFPGLEEFSGTNVPILHVMCRTFNPLLLPSEYLIENGMMACYTLEYSKPDNKLSSFTSVYSFGNEVLKVNDEYFKTNVNQPFLLKFWKCFYLQLMGQPDSLDAALKGITIKQVIYDSSDCTSSFIPKKNVQAVLLFEFNRVATLTEAKCTTSRLLLPPSLGYASINPDNSNYSIRSAHAEKTAFGYPSAEARFAFSNSKFSFETDHVTVAQPVSFKLEEVGAGMLQYTPPDSGYEIKHQTMQFAPLSNFAPYYQTPLTATHPSANIDISAMRTNNDEAFFPDPFASHN